jgi:hypothetical protein
MQQTRAIILACIVYILCDEACIRYVWFHARASGQETYVDTVTHLAGPVQDGAVVAGAEALDNRREDDRHERLRHAVRHSRRRPDRHQRRVGAVGVPEHAQERRRRRFRLTAMLFAVPCPRHQQYIFCFALPSCLLASCCAHLSLF